MSGLTISMVRCATDTETRDVSVEKVLEAIRTGGERLTGQITRIRTRFEAELAITGDPEKAQRAAAGVKKELPAVLWSGTFTKRANDALVQHSGLLTADLDSLGERLLEIRKKLQASPHVATVFLSPTGHGLKAVFRVPPDASQHLSSFRAVQKYIRELTGCEIDEKCKDSARLCFMSYDPELYVNDDPVEITPLPEPEKRARVQFNGESPPDLNLRERIATNLLGQLRWSTEKGGYFCDCPGEAYHTNSTAEKHTIVYLDSVPTLDCQHESCKKIVEAFNAKLRSEIGKAEYQQIHDTPKLLARQDGESEPLPPLVPYVPPPLDLLPPVLSDYVHASAEALNVDVAFILLPLLSSLGAAIGNACSIILKRDFIQPPVIWTGIIGRSGSRKSPALDAGCFVIMEHERELMQQNKVAAERFAEELAEWEAKEKKRHGVKPALLEPLTCLMDKLTFEALADKIESNRRGVLIKKDELSHWFESFDQYHSARGADVGQWLSLHTGVLFALDRRTDKRSYRIWQPRVCITGGIQPKVFRRILTPDYFERGLPARFVFADPPFRPDKWSEASVPETIRNAVLELFDELWLVQPERDGEKRQPTLLRLDAEAKAAFVAFYNETGAASAEADERGEAAWCKLSGYAARLALVGQLARDPRAEVATSDTMRAACDLARWFGNEAMRIYAELAETRDQREQRELYEFVQRRGGTVTERDLVTYYRPIKNLGVGATEKATEMLNVLVRTGWGKWEESQPSRRGRPTRLFQLLLASASAKITDLRGKGSNCADADTVGNQKATPSDAVVVNARVVE